MVTPRLATISCIYIIMQPISARPSPRCTAASCALNVCSPCQRTMTRTRRRKNQCVVREAAIASTETGEPFTA